MAYYSLPLFLLFLSLSLSLQIQARESRFFSKTTRFDPSKESTPFAEEEPFKTTNYNYDTEFSVDNRNTNNNNNPSMFSKEEFNKYETKIPNYPNNDKQNYDKQYGMSDTRFMENGKYFYDVNAEKYGRGYEPNGERSYGNYGNGHGYEYSNEVRGYENSRENYEGQEEYVP